MLSMDSSFIKKSEHASKFTNTHRNCIVNYFQYISLLFFLFWMIFLFFFFLRLFFLFSLSFCMLFYAVCCVFCIFYIQRRKWSQHFLFRHNLASLVRFFKFLNEILILFFCFFFSFFAFERVESECCYVRKCV